MKKEFVLYELWVMASSAAFQRANVYKTNASTHEKKIFKKALKDYVISIAAIYNSGKIEDSKHLEHIYSISTFTEKHSNILENEKLNFGISQKLLNVYLKYLWCLDMLKYPPPHFPIDRLIQQELKISHPFSWTKMADEKDYLKVIEKAKERLLAEKIEGVSNLPELELYLFKRRSNKN